MSKVQVAVRLRPYNQRERDKKKDVLCVEMQGTQTILDGAMHKHGKQQVRTHLFSIISKRMNVDEPKLLCVLFS